MSPSLRLSFFDFNKDTDFTMAPRCGSWEEKSALKNSGLFTKVLQTVDLTFLLSLLLFLSSWLSRACVSVHGLVVDTLQGLCRCGCD